MPVSRGPAAAQAMIRRPVCYPAPIPRRTSRDPRSAPMERRTVDVYERHAADWMARRPASRADAARHFAARVGPAGPRADLGCGPGSYTGMVGSPVVGLDAAFAMVELARTNVPGAWLVQGDLEHLPFRRHSLRGAWARAAYLHVARQHLPLALAELHHALDLNAPIELTMKRGS